MNYGFDLMGNIRQAETGKDFDFSFPSEKIHVFYASYTTENNPLAPPDENRETFGYENLIVPDMTMANAAATLTGEYLVERGDYFFAGYGDFGQYLYERLGYMRYTKLGFLKYELLSDSERNEIAAIIKDMTGLTPEEVYERVRDIGVSGSFAVRSDFDATGKIPIVISYEDFLVKMKTVDDIIGGGSGYAEDKLESFASRPITYEEKLQEYKYLMDQDGIGNAYARYYCDYMGIVVALFGAFIPVTYLMRDRRGGLAQTIMAKRISSSRLILSRYFASAAMMILPIILLSVLPATQLAVFGSARGIETQPLAFLPHVALWLLPTVFVVTGVGFLFALLTDTPIAILIQGVWSYATLIATPMTGSGGIRGAGLLLRFNEVGGGEIVREAFASIFLNRVAYMVLSAALVSLCVLIYHHKRRGQIDLRGRFKR
jgi:hypothetical protein